jgi:hypothetical protein
MQLQVIQEKIFKIREQKVMLDFDLATLYEVETKVRNQAVKRNIDSFPEDFMFRLSDQEFQSMRSQIVTSKRGGKIDQIGLLRERMGEHDAQLNQIYDAIESLLDHKVEQKSWEERERIGFKKQSLHS